MYEDIKNRLNSGNTCNRYVQNFVFPSPLKNLRNKTHKTIILPIVLYGRETWSLTLRDEHEVRIFENRVLRRIFGPVGEEVAGDWRRLHNEDLHNLQAFPFIIIRTIKSRKVTGRECSVQGADEKCIRNFGRKTREDASWKTRHS